MEKFANVYDFIFPDALEKTDCSIINCGHENAVSQSYYNDGSRRGNYEMAIWQYTLSGQGILEYDGVRYDVLPGQAFVAVVPENHRYYLPKKSENWEFLFLTLHGKNSIKLFKDYRRRFGAVINFEADSKTVESAWKMFYIARERSMENVYQLSALTYSFIMQMFAEGHDELERNTNAPAWLRKVKDYCIRNVDSDIMIEDLAKIAGCSKWHFSRQFAQYEGVSPHRYLMDLRVKSATMLLENSTLSIKEIADKCGFYDLAYFGKVFKSYMKMSPKKYRR